MRIHYLQHVPFEGPGSIEHWARLHGHTLTGTRVYAEDPFPDIQHIDWLIILGGPMNIYEEVDHPWLKREKMYIADALRQGLTILGICLGAQLIAEQLGGRVITNPFKEIGWLPINLTEEAQQSVIFKDFPEHPIVFHWHGDTFDLPQNAQRIASSSGCTNQAFVYNHCVVGLQFHLESTEENIELLLKNCSNEMKPDIYVQSEEEIRSSLGYINQNKKILYLMLDRMEGVQ